jgi:hypothetical protein
MPACQLGFFPADWFAGAALLILVSCLDIYCFVYKLLGLILDRWYLSLLEVGICVLG